MGVTSIAAQCTTIKTWMDELHKSVIANGLERVQNYDELTEGMNTLPTAQIYWNDLSIDSTTDTVAYTLPSKRRARDLTYFIDIYVKRRNHLRLNMSETVRWADLLWDKLEEKAVCGAFNDDPAVNVISMDVERVTFEYATTLYPGVRATIIVRAF
jgi:hypothetical protein